MRKIVNGENKQVYEIVVDLACSCDYDGGEKIAKIVEKNLKKRGIFDYEVSFSNWRVEINVTDSRDCYIVMGMLELMMQNKETRINKFEVEVSTF